MHLQVRITVLVALLTKARSTNDFQMNHGVCPTGWLWGTPSWLLALRSDSSTS